ncbi:MAG: hypothetical protein QOG23_4763 [Blastocatellia bacterium]|jgi:hypothetical protein|nr:hypothetical protein [Blastocatellia bacterium]
MTFNTIGDAVQSKSQEVKPAVNEVSVFKQLIKERVHPLDLVRELLSNAGAEQVGATKIEISYTQDKDGHIFEISDDGCGMNYTGNISLPGRLDKFMGLGLSSIVGIASDEFSWKGLGSKLSYQSRRVEIETCSGEPNLTYDVRVNEPWETLNNNNVPRPRISDYPAQPKGTKIKVIGHPPHKKGEEPFSFDSIKTFLLHRTFAGFTINRANPPQIWLSVLGRTEQIPFGFPELKAIDFNSFDGLLLDESAQILYIDLVPKSSKTIRVRMKGFLTWDPSPQDLRWDNYNTGLILSVKGIPYFNLDMEEYGATSIRTARPGEERACLVLDCDAIQEEMNISRSALVDSSQTDELKKAVAELFDTIEKSDLYLSFRRLPERRKVEKQGGILAEAKRAIEQPGQTWVVLDKGADGPTVLMREPQNESEVNALIWKLEALRALPFEIFNSLAYIGAASGPDLLANFQEDKASEPHRGVVIEIENNFYNYKTHGHTPTQYPKVICWDVPSSGRKAKINKTGKPYKFTLTTDDYQVHIYALKYMDGIKVLSREELQKRGVNI